MLLSFFSLLPLTALVLGDVNTVLNDLTKLTNDLTTLDADIKKVQSGLLGVTPTLQVNVDTLTVDDDIIQTTTDVNNAEKFSASDSQSLITSINTVTQQSNVTLTDLISKNASFYELEPVVLACLHALQTDQSNLGYAFAGKLDSSVINQGVADLEALSAGFALAIAAFGGGDSYYG